MSRWQRGLVAAGAVGLLVLGFLVGQAWAAKTHLDNDHVQHHMLIIVMNELIRRDPSLAAFVDAALGVPETVTTPVVEDLPEPVEETPPEQP